MTMAVPTRDPAPLMGQAGRFGVPLLTDPGVNSPWRLSQESVFICLGQPPETEQCHRVNGAHCKTHVSPTENQQVFREGWGQDSCPEEVSVSDFRGPLCGVTTVQAKTRCLKDLIVLRVVQVNPC